MKYTPAALTDEHIHQLKEPKESSLKGKRKGREQVTVFLSTYGICRNLI